uniref:Uncharacterized protein n=1 Tax=Arundo donax TaxID=35708 RepID=A0A0A9BBV7_ARUDO
MIQNTVNNFNEDDSSLPSMEDVTAAQLS